MSIIYEKLTVNIEKKQNNAENREKCEKNNTK